MAKREMMCHKIVLAARARFAHYGYGKTTMCEIAEDCKMSPGNIYRYFAAKLDIAEEIAEVHTDERLEEARNIVRNLKLSALDRLHEFLFDGLRKTYEILDIDPRMFEVAQIISEERPEFANRQLAKERALMAEILSAGNASGEFNIKDVLFVAEMIQSATFKYKFPQLHSKLSLDKLERELEGVLEMLFRGLCVSRDDSSTAH